MKIYITSFVLHFILSRLFFMFVINKKLKLYVMSEKAQTKAAKPSPLFWVSQTRKGDGGGSANKTEKSCEIIFSWRGLSTMKYLHM